MLDNQGYIDHVNKLKAIYSKEGNIKSECRLTRNHDVALSIRKKNFEQRKRAKDEHLARENQKMNKILSGTVKMRKKKLFVILRF